MRVLIVASEVPPVASGVARAVGEIATGLRDRGHAVTTLSTADGRNLRWDRLRLSTAGLAVRRHVRAVGPFDVVNVHGPAPTLSDVALVQLLGSRRPRPPVVYTHHFSMHFGVHGADIAGRVYDACTRWVAGRSAAIVTTTPSYGALFASRCRKPVHVIPWGVRHHAGEPTHVPTYDGERPLRVLVVGQFRRYKGMAVAVDAVSGVPELNLTLVGNGPLVPYVLDRVRESGASNVEFLGAVSDDRLATLFAEHDVIALPSRTRAEAFGIVLLEGMARGCVPVASDLPGVRDVVADVGLTATPGCARSLREVLMALAGDPAEVIRRQKLARVAATGYSWDSVVASYEQVLGAAAAAP